MSSQSAKDRAKVRAVSEYRKLYTPLMGLIDALQELEPGGTLVDDIVITQDEQEIRIAYTAQPVMLTIKEKNRTLVLRVVEAG